jgi:DNA topoisomerase-1
MPRQEQKETAHVRAALARRARLAHALDDSPGWRRHKRGAGFVYVGIGGKPLRSASAVARIKALAIPLAWSDVWISPRANSHLQATGRDARGRKQYLYHERWGVQREQRKLARMLAFGKSLPRIRQLVARDLRRAGLPIEKVLAAVVRLIDRTGVRVGNEEYASANGSFGLTTLQDRHAAVRGRTVQLHFAGKSNRTHDVQIDDPRLASIVSRCQRLRGRDLFQYRDAAGKTHDVKSHQVNEYLRSASNNDFTAKDFRTWTGTTLALHSLTASGPAESNADARRNIVQALDVVAEQLGNTRAVCRKSYVVPELLQAYASGKLPARRNNHRASRNVRASESRALATLAWLHRHPLRGAEHNHQRRVS